jgi:hypothetical protein
VSLQVVLELLATSEDLAAGCAVGSAVEFVALPRLELRVLVTFMALPVVLAAEGLLAVAESATVWLFMPLLVFPESEVSKRSWSVSRNAVATYFSSHCRGNVFLHDSLGQVYLGASPDTTEGVVVAFFRVCWLLSWMNSSRRSSGTVSKNFRRD